jgi:RNA polymerase sigma factor (sigma-70 family)
MTETIQGKAEMGCPEKVEYGQTQTVQDNLGRFKEIYDRWLVPVYHYFYFRVGNSKDAEDLTSQVFLKVCEELPKYHEHGQFPAWLFTIARHKAVDFYRTGWREVPLEAIDSLESQHDLLSQAVSSDEIRRLQHLIHSLPDDDQELIRLRFVAELGYGEIGIVVNRKEDAVRKSISRLLARLQNQLEVHHD